MTVTVQAAMAGEMIGVMIGRQAVVVAPSDEMIGVMIGRQAVVVAQQANPPMVIAVKRVWPVVAVLREAVVRIVTIAQAAMTVQIVIVLQNVMIRPSREGGFKGRDGQARPARGGKPAFGDKPARSGKPSFGSKPAFNKRPNFGDKPAVQKSSSNRGSDGAKRASPAPKKRVGAARPSRNATPQGGQGTLKRRR
jgi:hypothetical protein